MGKIEGLIAELVRNMGYIIDELNDKYSMTVEEIKEYKRAKRVIELCQAELENRCVIFPVRFSDLIYAEGWESGVVDEGTVVDCHLSLDNKSFQISFKPKTPDKACIKLADGLRHGIFGKTVFLTQEDAENALKGEGRE